MKKIGLAVLMGMILIIQGCAEDSQPLECRADIGCTEVFVTFTYAPSDNQGNAIILDSYYSQNMDNGQTYTFTGQDSQFTKGLYTVLTDAQLGEIKANGTNIRFIGTKDGAIVVEQDFLIGHDCCHIVPLQGPGID
ncbi:MAG: hypothetical protein HEP71_01895 [Roseivirga sp.]|nr:hypothetical protein [Roseivirga sp.]